MSWSTEIRLRISGGGTILSRLLYMLLISNILHKSKTRPTSQGSTADTVELSLQLLGLCKLQKPGFQLFEICGCNKAVFPEQEATSLVQYHGVSQDLN